MSLTMFDYAIWYKKRGLSVVPFKKDKTSALVKWKEYRTRYPTDEELSTWFNKWHDAFLAIITGSLSRVMVVDCDSQEAYDWLNEYYLNDSFKTPIAKTKRGYHVYFKYREGLSNDSEYHKNIDVRTEGGLIIAPPSANWHGVVYKWITGFEFGKVEVADIPDELFQYFLAKCGNCGNTGSCGTSNALVLDNISNSTNIAKPMPKNKWADRFSDKISEGVRDETLFHIANTVTKGGMSVEESEKFLRLINNNCFNPPLPEDQLSLKLKSALDRDGIRLKNIMQEVREWVISTNGLIYSTEFHKISQFPQNLRIQKTISQCFARLVEEGVIERHGGKNGCFRKIEHHCDDIDFINCETKPLQIELPLDMSRLVEVMPSNIVVVAGVTNAGKTGFLLDIIRYNMDKFDVWYFNSEMDGPELQKRLRRYKDIRSLSEWKFHSKAVVPNMEDVIARGVGKINIIDYLEVHEDFYKIGGMIRAIHQKLEGAVCFIALQKNPGTATGKGGWGTLEKARLAVNIEGGRCEIVKAKNWRTDMNPNGRSRQFNLVDGWDLQAIGNWDRVIK